MEDTKTEFEKIFNQCIKPVLEVYGVFKDFYGHQRVDIHNINSFETFWENNKTTTVGNFSFKSNVSIAKEEELEYLLKTELQNLPPEVLQYYDIPLALSKLYKPYIIIHWDKVIITNENNKSVEIQDLFSRTQVSLDGTIIGNPNFLRSTFPEIQWSSNYMHSHISSIEKNNLNEWKSSCLGSGPIRDTITTLSLRNDLNYWQLYCLELDKYVHVESLTGNPYNYLEKIGSSSTVQIYGTTKCFDSLSSLGAYTYFIRTLDIEEWKDFVKYFINTTDFKFHFINDYRLALPFAQFAILASNKFIEWFNAKYKDSPDKSILLSRLKTNCILYQGVWSNNTLKKYEEEGGVDIPSLENANTCILKFKGQDVGLKIIPSKISSDNTVYMLSASIVGWLYYNITKIVNYEKRTNIEKPKY